MPFSRRSLPWLLLLLMAAATVLRDPPGPFDYTYNAMAADSAAADLDLNSLVVVTEDTYYNGGHEGCDAISIFDVGSGATVFKGRTIASPGRLASTSDLSTILAVNTNNSTPILYLARRDPPNGRRWIVEPAVKGANFISSGGIAVAPDDDTLLVSTAAHASRESDGPPYTVDKYRLSELQRGRVGPLRGSITVPGRVSEIVVTADGREAHIFTVTGHVLSIDIATMLEVAPVVQAEPLSGADPRLPLAAYSHASVSPDGRYLITNRWGSPRLNVVDLVDRTATTATVSFQPIGDVAFSYGPHNAGLLAVHGMRRVAVLEFEPPDTLREVARAAVSPPYVGPQPSGPYASIAWSGDGSHLIAATRNDDAEF